MTAVKDSEVSSNYGYQVTLSNSEAKKSAQLLAQSMETASDPDVYKPVDPSKVTTGKNNEWIAEVTLKVTLANQNMARLQVYDAKTKEYEIPEELFERPKEDIQTSLSKSFNTTADAAANFGFNVMNRDSGKPIVSSGKRKFVIQDKFKEMGFEIASQEVYGLGLSNRQFTLDTGAYTMYAKNRKEGAVLDQSLGGQQGPAVHPFVMFKTDDNQFAGIYFAGSAPAQFEVVRYDGYD
jgi:hypothetical protein